MDKWIALNQAPDTFSRFESVISDAWRFQFPPILKVEKEHAKKLFV